MKPFLWILAVLCAGTAAAQERFELMMRRNPWNQGAIAAGIRCDSVSRSYAELSFTKENGGLKEYSDSDDSWSIGARTESVRHFDKVSFAGRFAYDRFDGKNMYGSVFTHPGYYPFDLLESTPGRKVRERYAFAGDVAARLGEYWTGGLKMDFTMQNYAKRKDLRHKNTFLDFEVAPGVMYRRGRTAIGAAYIVGKNSDRVAIEQIGTGLYDIFLDKGLGFGSLSNWGNNEVLFDMKGGVVPVSEITQGASLGVQQGGFFLEAAYRGRSGKSGERQTQWHDFFTSQVTVRTTMALPVPQGTHFIRLHGDWQRLENRESILHQTTENGITTTLNLGSVPIFGRRTLELGAEYEWVTRRLDLRSGIVLWRDARQATQTYPRIDRQQMHSVQAYVHAIWTLGEWELTAGTDFRTGDFSEHTRYVAGAIEPEGYPDRLQSAYDYMNEYSSADCLGVEAGLRRNIRRFYIDLLVHYRHGFNLRYIPDADRVSATLSVGYNF